MRKTILAGMTILAGSASQPWPARRRPRHIDYPWCVQGRDVGYPGDCSYPTYQQCQAQRFGPLCLLRRQSARRVSAAAARSRGATRAPRGHGPTY